MSDLLLDPDEVRRWWEQANDEPRRMAEIAIAELRERAANGDANADVVLWDWQVAGAIQRLKRSRQGLRTVIVPKGTGVRGNGHASLPVSLSVRRVDGTQQLLVWDTLTFADFGVWLRDYRAQTQTRVDVLRTLERLFGIWADHADVLGAEALTLAGIDPSELSESEAA